MFTQHRVFTRQPVPSAAFDLAAFENLIAVSFARGRMPDVRRYKRRTDPMIHASVPTSSPTIDRTIGDRTMGGPRLGLIPNVCVVATTIAIVMMATVVEARSALRLHGASMSVAQQRDIGASAAAAAASAASGGQVLDVKRHSSAAGVMYRVKVLLPGGRVRSMSVDGQSGQIR